MEQYIGTEKILTVFALEDNKTPTGETMVEVTFDDGKKEIMPKKRLELLTTNEISDATAAHITLKAHVASVLYGVLHEYGIRMGEINSVCDGMVDLANNGFAKASNILFKTEDKDFISLNSVNDILIENASRTETKE